MSSELQFRNTVTGDTVYSIVQALDATWANMTSSALESFLVANWTKYKIALTETPAGSYLYIGDFPGWITTPGTYFFLPFKQLGGSAAITDDVLVQEPGVIGWDGTKEVPVAWSSVMADLTAGAPSSTCTALTAINYIFEAWRNRTVTDISGATKYVTLYKDDGVTSLTKAIIADNGIDTFTKGIYAAP